MGSLKPEAASRLPLGLNVTLLRDEEPALKGEPGTSRSVPFADTDHMWTLWLNAPAPASSFPSGLKARLEKPPPGRGGVTATCRSDPSICTANVVTPRTWPAASSFPSGPNASDDSPLHLKGEPGTSRT